MKYDIYTKIQTLLSQLEFARRVYIAKRLILYCLLCILLNKSMYCVSNIPAATRMHCEARVLAFGSRGSVENGDVLQYVSSACYMQIDLIF